jgi:ATP-dependent DNA helicase PIF1
LPQNPSEFETDIDDYTPLPDLGLTLSAEQLHASVTLLLMLDAFIPGNVLTVVARAGTGKSAWVHSMVNQLRARHQSSICVAASALAATALPHGRTAHAAFNIPVPCHEDTYLIWSDADKKRIRRASIIFWDEISMVSIHLTNALNRSLQRLMKNEAYFGGKCIVFLGDFRQLAPVESTGCTASRLSVTQADWFDLSVKIEFTFNFRASRDMAYAALLESIGDGIINEIEVPASRRMLDIEEMIDQVYVDGITNYTNKNMILAMTLDQCADINEKCMLRVPGDAKLAVASDDLRSCTSPDLYPPEYIASLNFGGVPPAQLTFKKHARYMIIKNYNPPDVCNGVLCELLSWSKFNVQVRLLSGPGVGRIIMIPRCNFSINEAKSGLPFSFARWQFPLIPAYAVTIHKSQGQTLNVVGLLIEADAFAHGIIYVALSRVSSWSNVCFFSPEGSITIKNKVCRQLLAAARVSSIRRLNYPSRL